jgi:hypothetical protein
MLWTEAGMQIDERDEHLENTPLSRHETLQRGSNVRLDSWRQERKARSDMTSTEAGMQIDESD